MRLLFSMFGLSALLAGAVVLDNVLKYGFHRTRPVPFIGIDPVSYSFPSGHAIYATCFFGAAAIVLAAEFRDGLGRTAIGAASVLLITGIGLSRIYLGVHYPTDVLGGYLVGIFWISVSRIVFPSHST